MKSLTYRERRRLPEENQNADKSVIDSEVIDALYAVKNAVGRSIYQINDNDALKSDEIIMYPFYFHPPGVWTEQIFDIHVSNLQ